MKLSEFGVRWPVTTSMIFIAIVIIGAFSFTRVGIDLMPEMDIPVISVITVYSGAGPQEIETRITELIEERVSTVQNVDKVTSASMEGISLISVKFAWDTDLAEATNDIREQIDLIRKRLPDGAETPVIMKFDMSMMPILVLGDTADESWEKLDRIDPALMVANTEKKGQYKIGVSVGFVSFPGDAGRVDELINLADERMYTDKQMRKELAAKNREMP